LIREPALTKIYGNNINNAARSKNGTGVLIAVVYYGATSKTSVFEVAVPVKKSPCSGWVYRKRCR
jgi:hypothetical protein